MKTRLTVLAPYALAIACLFVFGITTLAMAGAGTSGGSGPGGGCPVATSTSPGCVTLGAFSVSTYTASGVAPQWITTDTGTDTSQSGISAASASSTVAAFTFTPANVLDANDLIGAFKDTVGGTSVFTIDKEGDVVGNTFTVTTSGYISFSGATPSAAISSESAGTILDLQASGSTRMQITSAGIQPTSNNTYTSGTSALRWSNTFGVLGDFSGNVTVSDLTGDASVRGNCTLNGGTPSTCTATVTAGAFCVCSEVGTSAAVAAGGCAVNLVTTTLTITGPATSTAVVNYHCIL